MVIMAAVWLCINKAIAVTTGMASILQIIHLPFIGIYNAAMEETLKRYNHCYSLHTIPIDCLLLPCFARVSIANEGLWMQGRHLST
jgi:hypothetical protein